MKLRVIDRNPRHIKVNVFVAGVLNGTLTFLPDEWSEFQSLLMDDRPNDWVEVIQLNQPVCEVCRLRKKPIGRDAGAPLASSLCDQDCEGYHMDPRPGTEWD